MGARTSETTRAFKSSLRKYLKCALRIASQEWATLGFEPIECPSSSISAKHSATSIEVTSELATSLLLVRLLALRLSDENFKSYITAEVCNTILGSSQMLEKAMVAVNLKAFTELRSFCRAIFQGYNEVPYHNYLHAYHVLMSSNKLLDIVLEGGDSEEVSKNNTDITDLPFESNPLLHWSLLFGALIHDVDHLGVPNKQLVNENHPLAIQYNDQSVAEQRSLTVAFAELLKSEYDNLRQAVFPSGISQSSEYRKFRESVTSLILVTDISEPERGASVRQRWEKVFKDTETHHASRNIEDEMGSSAPKLAPPREHPTPRRQSKVVSTPSVSPKVSFPKLPHRRNIEVDDPWVEFGLTPSTHFPRNCGTSMHDTLGFWWFSPEVPDDDSCESDSINSFSEEDSIYSDISKEFVSQMEVARTPTEDSEDSIQIFLSDDYPSVNLQDSCASFNSSNHCLLSPTPMRTMSGGTKSNSSSFSRLHRSTKSISKVSPTNSSTSKAAPGKPYADLNDSFPNHASRSSLFSSLSRGSSKRHDGSHIEPRGGKVDSDVSKEHRGKSALRPLVSENSMVTVTTVDATTCSSFAKFDFSGCEFEESERELNVSTELNGKKPMDSVTADTTKTEKVNTVDHAIRSMSLMEHILLVSDVSHGMQSWDNMIKFSHRLSKEIRRSIMDGRSGGFSEDPLNDWYENQSAFLNGYMIPLAQRIERTHTLPSSSEHGESDKGLLTKLIHKNLDRWQEEGHEVIALWRRERDATEPAERPTQTSSRRKHSTKSPGKTGSEKRKSSRSHKSKGTVS